jgi:hypothetical protein
MPKLVLCKILRCLFFVLLSISLSGCALGDWEKTKIEEGLLYWIENKFKKEIDPKIEYELLHATIVYLPSAERELPPYLIERVAFKDDKEDEEIGHLMYLRAGSQEGNNLDRAFVFIRWQGKEQRISVAWELHYDIVSETWQRVRTYEPKEPFELFENPEGATPDC